MSKLTFAIQMEIDAEQYYLSQAENNKENSLHRAFMLLAEAERKHADLLKNRYSVADSAIDIDFPTDEPANLFSDKADYRRDAVAVPGQLEVYIFAREMEQKSIDLYREMRADIKDESTQQLIEFLIKQEQDHYAFFDELVTLLTRPRDWVEDAEFGSRKEY
ncbi:MAG TPA: ferritin family protein [Clostridia bacterium]|nr:ferritin family protein [Clostridia bacterium]